MRLSRLALGLSTALAISVMGTATATLSAAPRRDADDRRTMSGTIEID